MTDTSSKAQVTDAMVGAAMKSLFGKDIYDNYAETSEWLQEKVKGVTSALSAALAAQEKPELGILPDEKPDAPIENRPEWIWYCESTSGVPVVTFGRWQKHPQQARYKLAEIQPTEHDHPTRPEPGVAVPAGWKLVPIEPTAEMRLAWNTHPGNAESYFSPALYRAMLAAAPSPDLPEGEVETDTMQIGAAISTRYHASSVPLDLASMIADALTFDRKRRTSPSPIDKGEVK